MKVSLVLVNFKFNNHLYLFDLPADVMKAIGARTIFAVDVGSQDNWSITNYGDQLSGWWVLWKKWNPWASPVRVCMRKRREGTVGKGCAASKTMYSGCFKKLGLEEFSR